MLVLAVLLVDALFIGLYFLADLPAAGDSTKVIFTVLWTVTTLAVVLRGLARIRGARFNTTE
jgi:hypothetical protein